jgi:hypothetical protein
MNTLRNLIRHLFGPNDTARATVVDRELMAQTSTANIFVVTYRTPAGREFTRTVKENV